MIRDPETKLRYNIPDGFQETTNPNSVWRTLTHPGLDGEINFMFEDLSAGPGLDLESPESLFEMGEAAAKQWETFFPNFQLEDRAACTKLGQGVVIPRSGKGLAEGVKVRGQLNLLLFPNSLAFVSANEYLPANSVTELQIRAMQFLTSIEPEEPPESRQIDASQELIFLSHNSKDKPAVTSMTKKLQAAGFKVWLDKNDLALGDLFALEIDQALREARVMVLVLGEYGLGPWQATEYAYGVGKALNKKMKFIPIALSSTVDWPPLASTFNGIVPPDGVEELIERLKL